MRDFSYQLYSSRNFPPLEDTLRMVADLGYTQVEGYGALFTSNQEAAVLRGHLDDRGLTMPTAHFGLDLVASDPGKALEMARTIGLEAMLIPFIAPEQRPGDAAGWAAFGRSLAEIGKPIVDAGLSFGWHNHAFEIEDLGGEDAPLDLILQGGDHVGLELDLAWVKVGGDDPVAWIERYGDRMIAAHLKDIAPDGECADEDGWADVGHGVIDWPRVMAALDASSAKHFVMEHDNPSDHRRFAERSISFASNF